MRYLDTSLLVPLFIKEPKSPAMATWFAHIGTADLAVSEWTITEFASALSIKTRTGQIDASTRVQVQSDFLSFLHSRVQQTIVVTSTDFERAAHLCDRWQLSLRAGDALHLAIAERFQLIVCTLDQRMLTAASELGIVTETV